MTRRHRTCGDVAQLGERLVCNQEVEGSIPFVSILKRYPTRTYDQESALQVTRRSRDSISAKRIGGSQNFSRVRQFRSGGHTVDHQALARSHGSQGRPHSMAPTSFVMS